MVHTTLGFGRAMTRTLQRISDADAKVAREDMMVLSVCISPWDSDVFVSVAKENMSHDTVEKIPGRFTAKAFEGEYSNMGTWAKEVQESVTKETGKGFQKTSAMYFNYPTCPKKYGKNHVVILGQNRLRDILIDGT